MANEMNASAAVNRRNIGFRNIVILSPWLWVILKQIPKFVSDIYELKFTSDKSVFKLAKENPNNKYMWGTKPVDTDVSMQDLKKYS